MSVSDLSLFAGKAWSVHKFGGTSVQNAECFLKVARIIEDALGSRNNLSNCDEGGSPNIAIVVSAMGGKPKTTDLLLSTVSAAASRDDAAVQDAIQQILEKHSTCLEALFAKDMPSERDRLLGIFKKDVEDILDILKTVSLMKWQAERISELVSGYGELWSTQVLTALLRMRSQATSSTAIAVTSTVDLSTSVSMDADEDRIEPRGTSDENGGNRAAAIPPHEFYYVDARRVIVVDEDAIQNGAICWDISQTKLQDIYQEAYATVHPQTMLHLVMTGYVASNTHGVATTLQRDGSDYSAAILGRLLGATAITIWTDVDGCLSADPRRVPGAYVIPDVSCISEWSVVHRFQSNQMSHLSFYFPLL
jgi:bifunctional aspartokinase / homoserine dehydrogenase 1